MRIATLENHTVPQSICEIQTQLHQAGEERGHGGEGTRNQGLFQIKRNLNDIESQIEVLNFVI